LWLHSLKVAQLLRSAACLHTNQSRSYLNHLVTSGDLQVRHCLSRHQSFLQITLFCHLRGRCHKYKLSPILSSCQMKCPVKITISFTPTERKLAATKRSIFVMCNTQFDTCILETLHSI